MEFHPSKCQLLRVMNCRNAIHVSYTVHGHMLKHVDSAKYLDNLHAKLQWTQHIRYTFQKAYNTRGLNFVQRNPRACHRRIRAQCYSTLACLTMVCGSGIWDPYLQKDKDCLKKAQRFCIRFAYQDFSREASNTQMMKNPRTGASV